MVISAYSASDYTGMTGGDWSFYYGYEVQDDNEEWCFTAKNAARGMFISHSASELTSNKNQHCKCQEMLLLGIAKMLDEGIIR